MIYSFFQSSQAIADLLESAATWYPAGGALKGASDNENVGQKAVQSVKVAAEDEGDKRVSMAPDEPQLDEDVGADVACEFWDDLVGAAGEEKAAREGARLNAYHVRAAPHGVICARWLLFVQQNGGVFLTFFLFVLDDVVVFVTYSFLMIS